ncbi:uncharacterized protein LOC119722818 [Patiria miniata]|uniref:Uncharacterized protein n=1 Tax=Patiria miniata TaxID=46514 RepID=A0A913ZBE8_PATMI|nr:uncharacterized protein LOC119722818 [Patiria miniata]
MLRHKPLPPIHPAMSSYKAPVKSSVSFADLDTTSLQLDSRHNPGQAQASSGTVSTQRGLDVSRAPMNRPVFHARRSTVVGSTNKPEDGVAALSAALSVRYPLLQDTSTNDFKRSRSMYTTNATLMERKKPSDLKTDRFDNHKRHSNRRKKDQVLLTRGSHHSFPPGKVIKRNDDNSIIPQMFPKVRRVDRGGPCPTQLYNQTKLSYSEKSNGSIQLDHYVRRNSRPRMEPLRVPSTSTATSSEETLNSVISSSKMTLEGRDWPGRGFSPFFRPYSYLDEDLSVPPNSEIGPSRAQMSTTPYEH